ncbi:hypothetical protein ACH3VS_07325 [Streptomyces sp. WSLK1-3]|uniref:hypothetical protein n=1 Tax=Streptomyces sp. WSLK1-3 TaxID=3375475 RepID=UPI0037B006C9
MLDSAVHEAAVENAEELLTWRGLGLETMASLLVVSLRRTGDRSFQGQCQWPRAHPLNERTTTVQHHPLIAVETTRQLAAAIQRRHLLAGEAPVYGAVSVRLGLSRSGQPVESGSATDVAVRVILSDLVTSAGSPVCFCVIAEYLYAGSPFAACAMRFTASGPEEREPLGEAVRPGLLHPAAAAVGAAADPDVLLARDARGRVVIAPRDPGHPVLLPGRPGSLTTPAVLEAGRQAVLLSSGMTAHAVVGLSAHVRSPVPDRGAAVEVVPEHGRTRFVVSVGGHVVATGGVSLLRS